MRELGLSRFHISFAQFAWSGMKKRLRELEPKLIMHQISREEEIKLYETIVKPYTNNIKVQTCTADSLITSELVVS